MVAIPFNVQLLFCKAFLFECIPRYCLCVIRLQMRAKIKLQLAALCIHCNSNVQVL